MEEGGYRSGGLQQRIRIKKVLVHLEQGAMKGEVTGVVKHLQDCCEGLSLPSVSKGLGQEGNGEGLKP